MAAVLSTCMGEINVTYQLQLSQNQSFANSIEFRDRLMAVVPRSMKINWL